MVLGEGAIVDGERRNPPAMLTSESLRGAALGQKRRMGKKKWSKNG
jgi:hypothetical protein